MKKSTKIISGLCGVFSLLFVFCLVYCNSSSCSWLNWLTGEPQFSAAKIVRRQNTFPLVIIGSGPAGLSAAIYGARQKLKTLVIEGEEPGGLLTKTSYVENMPGFKSILGKDLMKQLHEQAEHFGAVFLDDIVEAIDLNQWPFVITTEEGKKIYALAIIISTGASPRRLGIPGENEYWGKGVTTCAICDAPFYKEKEVVVIGGGDSAVEESIQLAPYAKKIKILVRKSEMRAAPSMQELLKGYADKIEILYNIDPKKILGNGQQVTDIELYNNKTQETIVMPISGVFLAIGHNPNSQLLRNILRLDEHGYIVLKNRSQETSKQGVYAAGDVEDHRYRQAGVAAGSGIKAALEAASFLSEIGLTETISRDLEQTQIAQVKIIPSMVKKISSIQEFDQEFKNAQGGPVFVDFFAEYCPTCMQMLPYFDAIAEQYKNAATFIKVDFEKMSELAQKYHVLKVPALLVFKEGKLVARYNNPMKKQEIQELAAQIVGQTPVE